MQRNQHQQHQRRRRPVLLLISLLLLQILILGTHVTVSSCFQLNNNPTRRTTVQQRRQRPQQQQLTTTTCSLQQNDDADDDEEEDEGIISISSLSSSNRGGGGKKKKNQRMMRRQQNRDICIVGGALAGLSAALYMTQMDPSRHVTIYERDDITSTTVNGKNGNGKSTTSTVMAASFAAAGMLAPQSERLPMGPLLDLCLDSRRMFADFCNFVETLAKEEYHAAAAAGSSNNQGGAVYLPQQQQQPGDLLQPWEVGFVASGGFLAPAFAGDAVATWAPPNDSGTATWLDATQVRELEPHLHPHVVGGWWFPEDASVDARRLTCSLRAACVARGVQIQSGSAFEVTSLDLTDGQCQGLWLQNGMYIAANAVLVANGAWMRNLLPVPIEPHKGQSLSLRMPPGQPPILRRVLFAQDSYICPKADGRIVIGATVEAGSFDPHVTPAGIMHILTHALRLVPALKDLPIEETWAGLRPTTPDKGPILGKTPWENLFLAGGYWRNGVLLAPKTGQLLASLIVNGEDKLSAHDAQLLQAFAWDRFTSSQPQSRLVTAANARYAASMHPIHQRTSGIGVAASVGTELGSYSSARSAKEERQRDRNALFASSGGGGDGSAAKSLEEAFEAAAALGLQDAKAYTFGNNNKDKNAAADNDKKNYIASEPLWYEGSPDAFTVGSASDEENDNNVSTIDDNVTEKEDTSTTTRTDLAAAYQKILANKAKQSTTLDETANDNDDDERPDPGFRIVHVDAKTGQERTVPPYTSPGAFLSMLEKETKKNDASTNNNAQPSSIRRVEKQSSTAAATNVNNNSSNNNNNNNNKESNSSTSTTTATTSTTYNEQTFDGYTDIQAANSRSSRQEELAAMRAARQQNRIETLNEAQIGAISEDY